MNDVAIKFSKEDLILVETIINRFDPRSTTIKDIMFELNIGNLQRHVFKHPEIVKRKFAFKLTQEERVGAIGSSLNDYSDLPLFKTQYPSLLIPAFLKSVVCHNFEHIYKFVKKTAGFDNSLVYYQRVRFGNYDPEANDSLPVDTVWLEEEQKKTGAHKAAIKQAAYNSAVIRKEQNTIRPRFKPQGIAEQITSTRQSGLAYHTSNFGEDFEEYMREKKQAEANRDIANINSRRRPSQMLKNALFSGPSKSEENIDKPGLPEPF